MLNPPKVSRVEVTRVTHSEGTGEEGDPFRFVDDYFLPNGEFLHRHDAWMFGDDPIMRLNREASHSREHAKRHGVEVSVPPGTGMK